MLDTLLKIGEWQSQGKSEWDRFLEKPKIEYKDKNDNEIKNYMLPIIFDLDAMEVVIDKVTLEEYKENFVNTHKLLKTLSARNRKIYATVKGNNIKYIFNTFLGSSIENEKIEEADLLQSLKKEYPHALTDSFKYILENIANLKRNFLAYFSEINKKSGVREFSLNPIRQLLELTTSEKLVIIYVEVICSNIGICKPKPIAFFDEYISFLSAKFGIEKENVESLNKSGDGDELLCYASGESYNNITVMDLDRRDSLNKMFGAKTYLNYLPLFLKSKANKSYQVSEKNKELLEYGSNYLIKDEGLIRIAGIKHCIIPEFRSTDKVDLELALSDIYYKSDLLFSYKRIDNFTREIQAWTDSVFWINFLSLDYPPDKKYLKTQGVIKDISSFHFDHVLKCILSVDNEFENLDGCDWHWIKGNQSFNFFTLYKLIPVRESNVNIAFDVLKSIFENRTINIAILYRKFSELTLCYYYKRFKGYLNQKEPSNENYFNSSIKKFVFKYLAFFEVLKKLKLIDMEHMNSTQAEESLNKYDQAIQASAGNVFPGKNAQCCGMDAVTEKNQEDSNKPCKLQWPRPG